MPVSLGTATVVAAAVGGGVMLHRTIEQRKAVGAASKAAGKEAAKQRKWKEEMTGRELQAGEYFEELHTEQMELQAQAATISTLADLIATRRSEQPRQPIIYTTPAAKTVGPVTKINQAIAGFLGA